AYGAQLGQCSLVEFVVILLAATRGDASGSVLFPLLLLRLGQLLFFFRRFRLLHRGQLEVFAQVADAQFVPVERGVPVEGGVLHGTILAIRTVDGAEHDRAVLHGAADGPELVHGPGQGHSAGARHQAETGTQPGRPATRGRRGDGAEGLRPNSEGHTTGGRRRSRTRRRSARPLLYVP